MTMAQRLPKSISLASVPVDVIISVGRFAFALVLVGIWQLGHQKLGPAFIASPYATAVRLFDLIVSGVLFLHVGATLRVALLGFFIGWAAGILVATALFSSKRAEDILNVFILGSMGIPKFALAPLLILWFGLGDIPKAIITALMVFYVAFIATFAGLRSINPKLVAMAQIAGADRHWLYREVFWNSLLPYTFAGLKVALPRGVSAAIVGELLVGDKGLGFYIENARQTADIVGVYAGLIAVTVFVLFIDMLVGLLRKRLLKWMPRDPISAH